MKSYPRHLSPEWWYGHNRPGIKHCDDCGKAFGKDDRLCIIETQTSYFRGDDDVKAQCEACATAAGIQVPPTKAELKRLAYEGERTHLLRRLAEMDHARERLVTRLNQLTALISGGVNAEAIP